VQEQHQLLVVRTAASDTRVEEQDSAGIIHDAGECDPRHEAVRSAPAHFAVVKGHEVPDVESVVVETDRFFVVRKRE
jgi:hypothetical protein